MYRFGKNHIYTYMLVYRFGKKSYIYVYDFYIIALRGIYDQRKLSRPCLSRAMPKIKTQNWASITTEQVVVIRGGCIPRSRDVVLPTKTIQTIINNQSVNEVFVKLGKGQKWIWNAIGGVDRSKLFNTTFLFEIEKALKIYAEPSDASNSDSPPVDLMDGLEEVPSVSRRRNAGRNYSSVRCKDKISNVSVPVKPKSDEMREIRVYAESTRSLFISLTDIDWVLTFAKEEDDTKYGLHLDNANSEDDDEDACQVAGAKIHFCFRRYAWIASKNNIEKFVQAPRSMTAEKWDQAAHLHKYDCDFEQATDQQIHEATRFYVIWCMRPTGASEQP